ncbi:hypothetical protein FACS1894109_12810 [Spirochaetia bacterium]|nr:hypothetical protein FACS1894109_12810 [Spirochaetia bacterium]
MNKQEILKKLEDIIVCEEEYCITSLPSIILTKQVLSLKESLYNIAEVYFGTDNRFCKKLEAKMDFNNVDPELARKVVVERYMSIAIAMRERIELQAEEVQTWNQKILIPVNPKKIFVVHGRNEKKRSELFQFLRSLNLEPLEWSQAIEMTGIATPYIGEVLNIAFSNAQAIIVLLTPDDKVKLRDELQDKDEQASEKRFQYQARPNVLFEAGMAIACNEKRTIIVQIGKVKGFSDIAGRHIIHLNNSSERRQVFVQRLLNAGCPAVTSGTDWLKTGDFENE